MQEIFELLRQGRQANQQSLDLVGRSPFFQLGIVSNNMDPLGKRRVKCTLQSKGGQCETDWLFRLTHDPQNDPPLPKVGQTVAVMFIDGDPHSGVFFGLITNQLNPEKDQENPILDDTRQVEGDRQTRIDQNDTLLVGKKFRLQNDAGAYLELSELGAVVLGDAFGHTWTLGGTGGTQWIWNLNGASVEVINAGGFGINGKQVIVVGSTDSDGDTNNTRGY